MSERRELTQALLTWVDKARQEPGTAGAHLSEDLEEPGTYCLCAAWSAGADFEAHVAGPDFGVLLGALEVLGHGVRFELTGTEGCAQDPEELIRRLRRRNPASEGAGRRPLETRREARDRATQSNRLALQPGPEPGKEHPR